MAHLNKILLSAFVILFLVVIGEAAFYVYFQFNADKQVKPNLPKNNLEINPIKKEKITKANLAFINDPYYQSFFPISYDEEKNRFYINFDSKQYIYRRKRMAVDFASWNAMSTYAKDQVESLILIERLKGTISKTDTNKIINGKKYLYFMLTGSQKTPTEYKYNEGSLAKTKFVKIVDGVETPMKMEELKDGDIIIIEMKSDLTKPPKDPENTIEAKITKL